ncbi:MAG: hypothetical protein JJU36_11555 [Phycisphaeraceae bacterium]|nr:hypothetical protein [Phycisphaeraceae bacterium]
MTTPRLLALLWVLLPVFGTIEAKAELSWTLNNIAGDYENELVRLKVELPNNADGRNLVVREDGRVVRHQLEIHQGSIERIQQADIWVATTIGAGQSKRFEVSLDGRGAGAGAGDPLVRLREEGDFHELSNGVVSFRVPRRMALDQPRAPVLALRDGRGPWLGQSQWVTDRKLTGFDSQVIGDGPLFAKIRLRYEWEGKAGIDQDISSFSEVTVRLAPGHRHLEIHERHEMSRDDHWIIDIAHGWKPDRALVRIMGSGADGRAPAPPSRLVYGETRLGDTLVMLMPRWTQSYDHGWFFGAGDGQRFTGALVARAGQWIWPHDNLVLAKVKPSGDFAGLHCPTFRGARLWMLMVGPADLAPADGGRNDPIKGYVRRVAFQPLDKIMHDYITEWPGVEGRFAGEDFYSGNVNPTGFWRQQGRRELQNAGRERPSIQLLTRVQVMLDPDMFGSYWNFWSPENPNFYTDFMKRPIALGASLRDHPQFHIIRDRVEQVILEDLYHTITLPGGAGQECPGYQNHSAGIYRQLAPILRQYYDIDITRLERYRATEAFLLAVSVPDGPNNRISHPGGDTHPPGPRISGSVRGRVTEELPGFGVVFRNRPGTDRENYLAFKAGPNRGHYHGDQLSIHYAARARLIAVDHHVSYSPRAGQEHMHNRVAFHTEKLPWANMDGYERTIAIKTGPVADVAIGQVESPRLRITTEWPPEDWNTWLPEQVFETPLRYRRTIVQVKGGDEDYFVIRDQHDGPKVNATYCLHVYGNRAERRGDTIRFDRLTLFVATPREFEFGRHDFTHNNRGPESTKGIRLTVEGESSEFITVLYPHGSRTPEMRAIPGGVRVGEDEITFAGGIDEEADTVYARVARAGRTVLELKGDELDLERNQGEIGLFVPNAGYPFGPIPDWLIRQRAGLPEWAKPAVPRP